MCRAEEKERRWCRQGTSWVVGIAYGRNVNAATTIKVLVLCWHGPVEEASISNEVVLMLPCLLGTAAHQARQVQCSPGQP